jgi:Na+-transporting methylmalonyl-CoA/oxaloacetate decarboxylase gamma subunit
MNDKKRDIAGIAIVFAFLALALLLTLAMTDTPGRIAESVAEYQEARAMTEQAKALGTAIRALNTQAIMAQLGSGLLVLLLFAVMASVILGLGANVIPGIIARYKAVFEKQKPRPDGETPAELVQIGGQRENTSRGH